MESTNVSVHVTRLELVIRLLRDAPVGGMKWLREPRRVEGSGGEDLSTLALRSLG
jgi:hypothetical protein